MMAQYLNTNLTETLAILQNFEDDINEDEITLSYNTTKELLQVLIKSKSDYDKSSEEYLRDLKEKCLQYEQLAKSTKKEVSKKYQSQVKSLKEHKTSKEKKFGIESNVLEEITNKMQEVIEDRDILTEKETNLKEKERDDIVRDQATFALLTSTFNIKWDYTCDKNEVRGCITGKDLVPFSINKEQHDKSYTANHLWDLIELSI